MWGVESCDGGTYSGSGEFLGCGCSQSSVCAFNEIRQSVESERGESAHHAAWAFVRVDDGAHGCGHVVFLVVRVVSCRELDCPLFQAVALVDEALFANRQVVLSAFHLGRIDDGWWEFDLHSVVHNYLTWKLSPRFLQSPYA
ncbi:hypothetical protein HMPREF3048_10250 [Corynebacterium sp. HMSC075D04]|nr:hypothetical protein HMPREF3048_10250 [Corynebacterium sp. HMSC075D04]